MQAVAEPKRRSVEDLRALYRDLHQVGVDLRAASLAFQDMVRAGKFAERGRTHGYAPDDPDDRLNRSIDITREFEFLVAVTGAFSSGKSTLLNLLLGERDLLPSSAIPMTAVCTVIRHGDAPRAQVRYVPVEQCFARVRAHLGEALARGLEGPDQLTHALHRPQDFTDDPAAAASLQRFADLIDRHGELEAEVVRFEDRAPFIAGGGVLRANGETRYFAPTPQEEQEYLRLGGDPRRWVGKEWLALVRDVTLWVPSRLLENDIVLLDLPGLNCREDYHRRAIREYCNMADCILVAAFQPGNQADADVIAGFKKLSSNYKDKIFFVFNKVDQFAQEPQELARAVDYLARDTIGFDFPRERFFLTSAQLARAARSSASGWQNDLERLQQSLAGVDDALPGLRSWVQRMTRESDPGGIGHLRDSLCSFLVEDAYPTKVADVLRNYDAVVDSLARAASPTFEEAHSADASDLLRRSALDCYRQVEKLYLGAVHRFRSEYLRGQEGNGPGSLRRDLNGVLEHVHREAHKVIRSYFERPILSTPLVDDPVSEFDLLTVAQEASQNLRRELRDMIVSTVHAQVRSVFRDTLARSGAEQQLERVLRGAPDWLRRLEGTIARFEDTMLHSHKCIVGSRFFHMPRGRQLKRLARPVALDRLKGLLVEVFTDFYPAWIYENVYSDLIDRLWLALFLDCEDLERELTEFFRTSEGVVTRRQVLEQAQVTAAGDELGAFQTISMCQRIAELRRRRDALRERAGQLGVAS